jgi:Tfp pilus assembly protein PilF
LNSGIDMTTIPMTIREAFEHAASNYKARNFGAAEQICKQIIANNNDTFAARHLLAVVEAKLGKKESALANYDIALSLQPDNAEVLCNRGVLLFELNRIDDALDSLKQAIRLRPDYPEALTNCAPVLIRLNRYGLAVACCEKALGLKPDFPPALLNRGIALEGLHRFDEAIATYDRLIEIEPDNAQAHRNRAHALLLTGNYAEGWEEYEWRWQNEPLQSKKREFQQPLWLGKDKIANKTILLHAEQGIGDTIQFCRYVPIVASRGARVIFATHPRLLNLMSKLDGAAQVVSTDGPLPDFDLHCPLLSLPLALGTRLRTIPMSVRYLYPTTTALKAWHERLEPRSDLRPRIGLAWSGNGAHSNDHNRSIKLQSLLPLLAVDANFVSLQKDVRPDDADVLKERSDILHFGDQLADFTDTTALISQLDLVITADTSIAHLACALGKRTWIMLPFVPDWRWLLDREDSPWYPTARLFRQDTTCTWDSAIDRVRGALRSFSRGYMLKIENRAA